LAQADNPRITLRQCLIETGYLTFSFIYRMVKIDDLPIAFGQGKILAMKPSLARRYHFLQSKQ
jgi:hypothetical protein